MDQKNDQSKVNLPLESAKPGIAVNALVETASQQSQKNDSRPQINIVVPEGEQDKKNKQAGTAVPGGSQQIQQDHLSPKAITKKADFQATGGSSNMGMSMLSDETPSPADGNAQKKPHLGLKNLKSYNSNEINDFDRNDEGSQDEKNGQYNPYQEIQLPSKIYRDLFTQFPPQPLLPKSFHAKDDSPRSGGVYKFLKLTKFRGIDHGRSKFREEASKIEKINFPDGITMKKIFKVITKETHHVDQGTNPENPLLPAEEKREPQMTQFGELVYSRNNNNMKDFVQAKQKVPLHHREEKDEVLEENLLDVRNLLKNATCSQAANGKQPGQKALVNLQGIEAFYTKKDRMDKTLIFESRFESGNLAAALKVNENDYYLALQNDVNTSGNTQWFFFRVSNTKAYSQVRFSMLNLCKPDSLYNEGMKVLVYSEKHAQEKDIGWHRSGTKIAYYANGIRKDNCKGYKTLYSMTFNYEFEYNDDNVYFAYCYPYTYTELAEELNTIMADPIKQQYVQKKTLTETLAGNKCEVLTITSKQNPENMSKRKGVVLTARVHPGESVGSWMMKGALDFLVDSDSVEAEYLRQNFVFKVIPMLNPDGVINGNYRCSLAGCDLNRRWKRPSKVLHPTIFATKQLCHQFSKERDLQIFCDFHGHSRRKNIFMYGCNVPNQPEDTRLFPFIMSQICPFFVYNFSRFGNQKSKESTARMALFNELKCPAIYTIESSFCGNDMGPYKNYHFSTNNLMQTGRDFCRTLMLYLPIQIPKSITQTFMQNISDLYNHYKIISEGKMKPDPEVENMVYYFERLEKVKTQNKEIQSKHIKKGLAAVLRQTADIFTDGHSSSSVGSDHAPSEDNLDLEEIEKVIPVQEDAELANKLKKSRTLRMAEEKKELENQLQSKDQNPLKKGKTFNESKFKNKMGKTNALSSKSNKTDGKLKKDKFLNLNDAKIDEEVENDADDEQGPDKTPKSDEERDKVLDLKDDNVGNVIHKKRRRKNVESRDVQTQTDRSDYMLIKQRQQEKQKQLMVLLAQKNKDQADKDGVLLPKTDQSPSNQDQQQTQKLLEEYLQQQKQGLVENIMSQYNNQQMTGASPKNIYKSNNKEQVSFSNFILQNQTQQVAQLSQLSHLQFSQNNSNVGDDLGGGSPMNKAMITSKRQNAQSEQKNAVTPTQPQSAGYSPSKKHRNLIQSRAGAQAYMNQQSQQQSNATSNSRLVPPQNQPQLNQNFFNVNGQQNMKGMQSKRAGLSTAYSGQRQIRNPGENQVMNTQYTPMNKSPNDLVAQMNQHHSQSNSNLTTNQTASQSSKLNQQSHWQKVSTNNSELNKLFYQLPGGTKTLVQNAIQSTNQQNQQVYQTAQKKNTRKPSNLDKKHATPDMTSSKIIFANTKMSSLVGQSGAELPDISAQAQLLQNSSAKTPSQPVSRSFKKVQYTNAHQSYQNQLFLEQQARQQQFEFNNQMNQQQNNQGILNMPNDSYDHSVRQGSSHVNVNQLQHPGSIQHSHGSNKNLRVASSIHSMVNSSKKSSTAFVDAQHQAQVYPHTSKKPPTKSRLGRDIMPPRGQQQRVTQTQKKQRNAVPQSANQQRGTSQQVSWQKRQESLGGSVNSNKQNVQAQKTHLSSNVIQDNYDFQLGLNRQGGVKSTNDGGVGQQKHFEKRMTSIPGGQPNQQIINPGQQQAYPSTYYEGISNQGSTRGLGKNAHYTTDDRGQYPHQRIPYNENQQNYIVQDNSRISINQMQRNSFNSGSAFSNIYVGQALAAAQQNQPSSQDQQPRVVGQGLQQQQQLDPNKQKTNLTGGEFYIRGPKSDIMENAIIQSKLKQEINGDLNEIGQQEGMPFIEGLSTGLGDQITAEIVKKLSSNTAHQQQQNQNVAASSGQLTAFRNEIQIPSLMHQNYQVTTATRQKDTKSGVTQIVNVNNHINLHFQINNS